MFIHFFTFLCHFYPDPCSQQNIVNSTWYKITYWNFLSDIGSSAPELEDGEPGLNFGAGRGWV